MTGSTRRAAAMGAAVNVPKGPEAPESQGMDDTAVTSASCVLQVFVEVAAKGGSTVGERSLIRGYSSS